MLTKTRCPDCGQILEARFQEREGCLYLQYECSQHGAFEALFSKDVSLHHQLSHYHPGDGGLPLTGFSRDWNQFQEFATTCTIDVTTRCNMFCPDCLSAAGNRERVVDEPSVEDLLDCLPPVSKNGFRPNISLVGGESILRKDIDQIIAGMIRKGFTPRLNSNGKGLLDRALLTRLKKAGLLWIILQFDGFSSETSLRFRAEDLVEHKKKVIDLLGKFGFRIHFATMVEAGINDHEVTDILRYAVRTPQVRRVSFYPKTSVGRSDETEERYATDTADVVRALEEGTKGGITRKDLLEFKRIWDWMFHLTRNPVFRNRSCLIPFMIRRDRNDIVPLNRILKPGLNPHRWIQLGSLVKELPRLWNFNQGNYADDILPVNIEKLYATCAFDLKAAANCHQVYLTQHGFIHFCLYNSYFRTVPPSNPPEE